MNAFRPLAVSVALAAFSCCATAAGPFDGFKGKMKEGMYEYQMEMDMSGVPGLPPGMGKQTHKIERCLTQQDIDKGQVTRGDGKMPENCEVRDFKMSGNNASYTMECKGARPMKADSRITFRSDGYDVDMKMTMTQNGQAMNMAQKMNARYLGACKK